MKTPTLIKSNHQRGQMRLSLLRLLAVGMMGLLAVQNTEAHSANTDARRGGGHRSRGFSAYGYRGGHAYGRSNFGHRGYATRGFYGRPYFVSPHLGLFVPFLPLDAVALYAGALGFYYADGYYYQAVSDGYEVVPPPDTVYVQDGSTVVNENVAADTEITDAAPAPAPAPEPIKTKTVAVHNSNGSHTPVLLQYLNGHWTGPRGEEYDAFPTNKQLRAAYGF